MSASNRDADLLEAADEVDSLPRPSRRGLAFGRLEASCALAVRLAMAQSDPGKRAHEFRRVIRGIEPVSPATRSIDGWARLGAVEGAIGAWERSEIPGPPADAPSPRHLAVYVAAYSLARTLTMMSIQEVSHG